MNHIVKLMNLSGDICLHKQMFASTIADNVIHFTQKKQEKRLTVMLLLQKYRNGSVNNFF